MHALARGLLLGPRPQDVHEKRPSVVMRPPPSHLCHQLTRALALALRSMAKSTNHTAHNQSYKNHRNGIKKPERLGKGQRRKAKGVRC